LQEQNLDPSLTAEAVHQFISRRIVYTIKVGVEYDVLTLGFMEATGGSLKPTSAFG
jgi:hypothetical protein